MNKIDKETILQNIDSDGVFPFFGGVYPEENKWHTTQQPIQTLEEPEYYIVPIQQHKGNKGILLVKEGDKVLQGQPLTDFIDEPRTLTVHAPCSGSVEAIISHPIAHPSGLDDVCIKIINDKKYRLFYDDNPIHMNDPQLDKRYILNQIKQHGVAGLGGAVFPSYLKYVEKPLTCLIINGVECEPYITTDDVLMRYYAKEIIQGIALLDKLYSPLRIVIAIEDNKPQAIKAIETALMDNTIDNLTKVIVKKIKTKYPSGSEKQLVKLITDFEIPKNTLLSDMGIVMHNVATCYAIQTAVLHNQPVIDRIVTLAGDGFSQQGNYRIRLGTTVEWLLTQNMKYDKPQPNIIMGGPMMGFLLPSTQVPVVKAMNCLLFSLSNQTPDNTLEQNCIRCGDCVDVCPQKLLPQQLFWYAKGKEYKKIADYDLFDCIECGACAFVCPSNIPLVNYYRVAKSDIKEEKEKKRKADAAKIRFEARNERLKKEKEERERKIKENKARLAKKSIDSNVADAIARIKKKKETQNEDQSNKDVAELRKQRKENMRLQKEKQSDKLQNDKYEQVSSQDAVKTAIERIKAKKSAQQQHDRTTETHQDRMKTIIEEVKDKQTIHQDNVSRKK